MYTEYSNNCNKNDRESCNHSFLDDKKGSLVFKVAQLMIAKVHDHGWSQKNLEEAFDELGFFGLDKIMFTNGIKDYTNELFAMIIQCSIINATNMIIDAERQLNLNSQNSSSCLSKSLPVHRKIAINLYQIFHFLEDNNYRDVLPFMVKKLYLPNMICSATNSLWYASDKIWRSIGDTSTDHNFYTKRLLLMKIYGASLLYFSFNNKADHSAITKFIDKCISEILVLSKFKKWILSFFK